MKHCEFFYSKKPRSRSLGPEELGTVEPARNSGFLCVISLLSTLRKFFVTSAPRFNSANTAAVPLAALLAGGGAARNGGGGGGGGGGAPPVAGTGDLLENSATETPFATVSS